MFLRVTRIKRGDTIYQYGHFAESYRRKSDGRPTQRIVARLGKLTDLDVSNFRATLEAKKTGQRVALFSDALPLPRPIANLDYLDIAVLLAQWEDWGLSELLGQLLPAGKGEIPPADVVAALACQRCVSPGSKLFATRWVPRTALPELLGFDAAAMNNTRIHRVLDALADVEEAVQAALPKRYHDRDGAFLALFLDTTDAVFEGRGPPQARLSKWKDGQLKRRIAIPLLCNARGYPIRWDVIDGTAPDCHTFPELLERVAGCSWARNVPVVMDRAAGSTATLNELLQTDLLVLTALRRPEFPAYAPSLPTNGFEDLSHEDPERLRDAASEQAIAAGMQKVSEDLFVLDFAVVERTAPPTEPGRVADPDESRERQAQRRCQQALELAVQVGQEIESRTVPTQKAFARQHGVSPALISKYRKLLRLTPALREAVASQLLVGVGLDQLVRISALAESEQAAAVEALTAPPASDNSESSDRPQLAENPRVRCVAYFNPELFVSQRTRASHKLTQVRTAMDRLNVKLRRRSRPVRHIRASVDRLLKRNDLLGIFDLRIATTTLAETTRCVVHLDFDEKEWRRRRRFDGFCVLVAHPDLGRSAPEIAQLYRNRELIEHDFRTIKSFIQLNPVRHRIERKVRAHVTICMLALLLERTLKHRLVATHTAAAALEELATCHLNQFGPGCYALTEPTAAQLQLLHALDLKHLIANDEIMDRITPR